MTTPSIRPVQDSDRESVSAVIRAAFGDEGEHIATLWVDVVARGHVRAELVAVDAEDDTGPVLGHIGLSHAWLDTRSELVDVLVISPLSVLPDRQGSGLGAALVTGAVDEARRQGVPLVVLEGDPAYYGRLGLEPASAYGIESPSRRIPAPAFQVVPLPGREPWMTGRVIYHDVWWEHDAAGLRDPLLAQVEMNLLD